MVGDDRHFLGEALDVFSLLGNKTERNEEREVAIVVAGLLDPPIEILLHFFPNSVAPRLDDHCAAHRAGLGQIRFAHHRLVPLWEGASISSRSGYAERTLHGKSASIE